MPSAAFQSAETVLAVPDGERQVFVSESDRVLLSEGGRSTRPARGCVSQQLERHASDRSSGYDLCPSRTQRRQPSQNQPTFRPITIRDYGGLTLGLVYDTTLAV